MADQLTPIEPNRAPELLRATYLEIVRLMRGSLPPPLDNTPEGVARRERIAIDEAAALDPGSSVEARLAARHVIAGARADHCHVDAAQETDPKQVDRLLRQAACMGRESRGSLASLLRLQAERRKRDAIGEGADHAGWRSHCPRSLMLEALASLPPPEARPQLSLTAPAAAPEEPTPARPQVRKWRAYDDLTDEEKRQNQVRLQTERFAIEYTMQAKLIRQLGRLPDVCDFPVPGQEVLDRLISGEGASVAWVDTYMPWVPPEKS